MYFMFKNLVAVDTFTSKNEWFYENYVGQCTASDFDCYKTGNKSLVVNGHHCKAIGENIKKSREKNFCVFAITGGHVWGILNN